MKVQRSRGIAVLYLSSNKWRSRVFITSAKIISFKTLKGSVVSHMKASGGAVYLGFTVS